MIAWDKSVRVWWRAAWRGAIQGIVDGFALEGIAGALASVSGHPPLAPLCGRIGKFDADLPASMFALKQSLNLYLLGLASIVAEPISE